MFLSDIDLCQHVVLVRPNAPMLLEENKLFIEKETSEPKVKVFIPMYEVLKVETCKKCKSIIAEPKELIRIILFV